MGNAGASPICDPPTMCMFTIHVLQLNKKVQEYIFCVML